MAKIIMLDAPKKKKGYTDMGTRLVLFNELEQARHNSFAIIEMFADVNEKFKDRIFLSEKAYDKLKEHFGFKEGYHKCLHDFNIVHGKDAQRLLHEVNNPKPLTTKQKKFFKECDEIFRKCNIN